MRTINPEDCADQSGCERVVLCVPAAGLCCRVLIKGRCAPLCLSVSHSVTDEYKMKGVEKVKYISGDEGGVDSQDSTVRDSILCIPVFVSNGTFTECYVLCICLFLANSVNKRSHDKLNKLIQTTYHGFKMIRHH